jgi:putative flippase GtrA
MDSTTKQFISFSLSGVIGFGVDAGIVMVLDRLTHFALIPAQIVAFFVAVTVTWAINRRFTFWHKKSPNKIKEWIRYIGANAFGGVVNNSVFSALVIGYSMFAKTPVLAVAGGSIAGLLFNFSSSKILVFRHNDQDYSD